ncbi:phage antirepressor KilAC domain-containing protein [Capnocytophaga ochracea]|uniref:Phage anti-repressor protein n=1 Tax=Capnocytophaga ochracea TaxID=1018 RepID=A0A2X2SSG9_CAPOC|nr:phage antirepressor KilAC domain-containing protein [Capnocytophaga ochracea]SQA92481.1 Phage anti-repressor protein [Capnocytophaga ochracea]
MKELIKITEQNGNQAVSARELYKFLEVQTPFTMWIDRMLEYGFTENIDFEAANFFVNHPNGIGGTTVKDYALTLDCAKEISMLQRSERGKMARQYFIECEKQLRSGKFALPTTYKEALQSLLEEVEAKERLQAQNDLQRVELQKQAPKVAYYEDVLTSKSTYNANQIAKELGMSAVTLNKKLHELKVQYKQGGQWLLYHHHQDKGYTKTVTHTYTDSQGETRTSSSTVWTEKGREFIHSIIQ